MRVILGAIVVLAAVSRAAAEPREIVVVIADDAAFQSALDAELAPAGITTRRIEATPPTLTDIARVSRALADREHATATIWLVSAAGTTTLVAYDRDVDRMLVRALALAEPLDALRGAEAARSARTMLRALRVTPDTDLPPPRADQAPALRAAAAAVVAPAPMRGALALALGAGTRAGAPAASVAFDGNAAAIWRPDALGLALTGQYTPSHERTAGTFAGTASDEAVGLVARLPIALGVDRLRVVAMAGGALHVITLRGTIAAGTGVAETSYDPAVRAGAALEYALDPTVDVGVSAVADYLVQRQRYDVDASEILLIPRAQLEVAVVLTLRLL